MTYKDPYISFIGFARNDNYVPDRTERHNFSLQFLIDQLEEKKIPSEIVIVEWNYSENNTPLSEAIRITSLTEWTTIRVIRVPPRFHQRYKFWHEKPFHVGAAVNVGIRRALGKFILPIASDIFLSDSCLDLISRQELDDNTFYRCDRYDVDSNAINNFKLSKTKQKSEFFKLCEEHIKIHHQKINQSPSFSIADLHTNGCGDFCLISRKKIEMIRGFKEGKDAGGLDIDSLVIHALHGLGCEQRILPQDCKVYKISHNQSTASSVNSKMSSWQKHLESFLNKKTNPKMVVDIRMLLNYPKRTFSYAPNATFDSFEKNFVKPARRWAQKTPPFHSNRANWGLKKENFEEKTIDLLQ
jgi:glycosyltransferase involved in cell wall biosynthesis